MNRLFLRIFAWFIAIQIIALLVFVFALATVNEDRLFFGSGRARGGRFVHFLGASAQAAFIEGGAERLQQYQERVRRELKLHIQLIALPEPHALTGTDLVSGAPITLASGASAADAPLVFTRTDKEVSVTLRVAPLRVLRAIDPQPPSAPALWRRANLWRFLLAACASCLLCWWLARSLTRPLVELQQATRHLAAGEITARVSVTRRDEVGQLGHAFNAMAEKIAALLAERSELLRRVSHELRSPLARLHLTLELLRQQTERLPGNEASQTALTRCETEAQRLGALIAQLLHFNQATQAAPSAPRVVFDLEQLALDVASDGNYEAELQGRAVEVTESCACTVQGDRELLRSALENVVRNALRFTPPQTTVTVQLQTHQSHALLRIADCGPGVPTAALSQIFTPFFRLEPLSETNVGETNVGGAGLGLAIARHAVTTHGGTITAENGARGGLLVTVQLPLAEAPASQ